MTTGAHSHASSAGKPGADGKPGATGRPGPKGPSGRDSAPRNATLVFVGLNLVLIAVVSFQAIRFRDFNNRLCDLSRSHSALSAEEATQFHAFSEQEKSNRFIDDTLRAKRIASWDALASKADATVPLALRLCPS